MTRILIAHPEKNTCERLVSIFEKAGHSAGTAQDGASALESFRRDRPEIAVLNQVLPGMAAFQVFAEIKKLDPAAKVLVFAVRSGREAREGFGPRPLRTSEVLRLVEELENRHGKEEDPAGHFLPRVLVVDDDAGVRSTLLRFLKDKGYEAAAAADGEAAVALLKRLRPHLVLLDIDMPKMSGVETLKRIREIDGQVGVMMITGNDTIEMMERCAEYGAYDYLLKPFDLRYLEFSVHAKVLLMTL